jgi:FkbH-like protein
MKELFAELQWLPILPGDFSSMLSSLEAKSSPIGLDIQFLATHRLDLNQLTRLARAIEKARSEGRGLEPLTPFKLAVLTNSTMDLIVPALVATAARHGIALEVVQASYDQVAQEALLPSSRVNSAKPDAVLFALDYRALTLKFSAGDVAASEASLQGAINHLLMLQSAIKTNCGALCIFQTFPAPPERLFGSLDRALPGAQRHLLDSVNSRLAEFVLASGDVVFDVAGLAETVGLADWHNLRLWNMAKIPFAEEFTALYAEAAARVIAAIRGKSRRVLVLDLDNTLWGGVIGDDGLEGIRLGQGEPEGEAYLAVQKFVLDLRRRGIVLAVSSKNSDEVARTPFVQHPEMLIKLDDFAVFRANWNDKASNISAIAEELSLGLDAIVFLDDNPAERGLIRKLLPQVAIPELPDDPAYYARTLSAAGYFDSIAFTTEDSKRANLYKENTKRNTEMKQHAGVEAYLTSLNMIATFQRFDAVGRSRIVQLINKSNQFNLTTRRYTETEVAALEYDPAAFTMQVRLADVYGDLGMISVVVCRVTDLVTWEIDTWLMSCRVLGRRVESAVLWELIKHARAKGILKLIGKYRPTSRNELVKDHYAKLGFTKVTEEIGGSCWELAVENAKFEDLPITVISKDSFDENEPRGHDETSLEKTM